MKHVSEHVPAVKGNDGYEVCEAQQDVDPHQPEEEMSEQQQHIDAQGGANQAVPGRHQRFFKGMNGYTAQLKWNHQDAEHMERQGKGSLKQRPIKARGKRASQPVDASRAFRKALHAEEGVTRFDLEVVQGLLRARKKLFPLGIQMP